MTCVFRIDWDRVYLYQWKDSNGHQYQFNRPRLSIRPANNNQSVAIKNSGTLLDGAEKPPYITDLGDKTIEDQ